MSLIITGDGVHSCGNLQLQEALLLSPKVKTDTTVDLSLAIFKNSGEKVRIGGWSLEKMR